MSDRGQHTPSPTDPGSAEPTPADPTPTDITTAAASVHAASADTPRAVTNHPDTTHPDTDSPSTTHADTDPPAATHADTGPSAATRTDTDPPAATHAHAARTDGTHADTDFPDTTHAYADSAADDSTGAGTLHSTPGTDGVPLEISAAKNGEDDTPFRLTAPQSDETNASSGPANRGRTRTIVMASLLAVALGGAGTLAWFGWQVNSQRQTTLSTPAKIGALTLDDSEQATATADYLQTALSAEIAMTKAVGAVYTGNDEKSVLFFGGTTLLWSPDRDLDTAIQLMSDDQGAVTGLKEVDAGDFGGTMKCGVTKSAEGDLAVCGWADHGSLALAMFPNRTDTEAAPLMRELRSAIQTRN